MSESPQPPSALAILQPPARRRWHSRRARGANPRKLPPLHKEKDEVDGDKNDGRVEQESNLFQSSLMKAGALYGGRVSPPPRPFVRGAPPSAHEKRGRASEQDVHENPLSPPLVPICESDAEHMQEVHENTQSSDEEGGDSEVDPAAYMVSGLLGQAADFLDDHSSDGFASTCSAWSCYSDDSELEEEEVRNQELQPFPAQSGTVSPVAPEMPPPPKHRAAAATRTVAVARDRSSPLGMPTLDDLLLGGNRKGGKGQSRSQKSSPRAKLPPMVSGPDRRAPLTAR